jgi:hypothetical protein
MIAASASVARDDPQDDEEEDRLGPGHGMRRKAVWGMPAAGPMLLPAVPRIIRHE